MQDLQVTIDIDLLRMPCDLLDLRFVAHRNREHTIERWHLTAAGPVLMSRMRDFDEVSAALDAREGCKIRGTFFKHFVVNSFVVTVGNEPLALEIMALKRIAAYDLSHKVNSFLLGEASSHQYYEK